MYCNKCGEQIPDGSKYCLRCGYEVLGQDASSEPTSPEPDKPDDRDVQAQKGCEVAPKKTSKKIGVVVVALLVILVAVLWTRSATGAGITRNNVRLTQLYNTELGRGLKLGVTKANVDSILGLPEVRSEDYLYDSAYLCARYQDGRLVSMYIEYPNDRWITAGGLTVGMSEDELISRLGKPASIEHDDKWWYYISGQTVTGFNVVYGQINAIFIYTQTQ